MRWAHPPIVELRGAETSTAHPTYSPLILPLGLHSDTLSTFGGGPGTVALHGWPDPAAALRVLSRVPLGSSVTLDDG
jgi:hypothetical protein